MTEWDVAEMSFERWAEDLETVIGVARPTMPIVLLGISQGGAAAISYAVKHPENVSHLILYGAYAQGKARRNDQADEERWRAITALTRLGWGQDNPVYRQLFTSRFVPDASEAQMKWFNELCRRTTRADVAARIMDERSCVDVKALLPNVAVPTLVLHARNEEAVPFSQARLLASSIPGAKFVELDSRNHILLEDEPAWARFKEEVLSFTGVIAADDAEDPVFDVLSPREREILSWIAAGCTNIEIGKQLFISEKTVRNHVTRIFEKLDVHSRAQAIVMAKDKKLGVVSAAD